MSTVRVVAMAMLMLAGCSSTAFAGAGAPDPSFGTRGVVALAQRSTASIDNSTGRAVVLPDGGMVVPAYRTEYRMAHGEHVGIRNRSISLMWLRADGSTSRISAPIVIPKDVGWTQLVRTVDGHLLVTAGRYTANYEVRSLYVLRLSEAGIAEPAPGASSAAVSVSLASVPHIDPAPRRAVIKSVSVAPGGRVYFLIEQPRDRTEKEPERSGYGPLIVAAVDPSVGLATGFATGGLVAADAVDRRTSSAVATTVDESGRLLVLVRSMREGIGGTSQDVHVARYDDAGASDPTFAGGQVDVDAGTIDTAYTGVPSIAVLRGGDVLIRLNETTDLGSSTATGIELRRFTSTGQPAAGFGTNGRAVIVLQRSKSSGYGSRYSSDFGGGESSTLFEQPDGKLIVGVGSVDRIVNGRSVSRDGVLRATASGSLDATYEQSGFARFDAPWNVVTGAPSGIDAEGRMVATVASPEGRAWIVRLLAGDEPAPATSVRMDVDNRRACGAARVRACFDPDGAVRITGRVEAGGHAVVGASVIVGITRPSHSSEGYAAPPLPAVRTGTDGRFAIPLAKGRLRPGTWMATARVIATPSSQRVDVTRAVYFTLGPRAHIDLLRQLRRAQALASAIDYVVDDTIGYGEDDELTGQCRTVEVCVLPSAELGALVSATAHPLLGKAGLLLGKPGSYTVVTRAPTTKFRLEFIVTQTPDETFYTCRGDAAARKRWCPDGSWNGDFDDPFATAGIDGAPFDF